ncbi:hypothetical protein ACJRO7_012110 [Eucalyptus globulus]|uniref:Bet v I/Major latex protein domain-containing protein n=1 Tax=Eucalyptus globulus TaxID=34317 RepID=A0ABD3LHF9_EUCGL
MGLEGKVEEEFDINSPAHRFYKRLSYEQHHLPDASPDKVQGAEIHEGDWVTPGSVKLWNYTIDDDDGGCGRTHPEQYKAYKIVYQVFPKGESGTLKISLIYEKFNETDGKPHNYLRFLVDLVKDLD